MVLKRSYETDPENKVDMQELVKSGSEYAETSCVFLSEQIFMGTLHNSIISSLFAHSYP